LAEQPPAPMTLSEMLYGQLHYPNLTSFNEIPLEKSHLTLHPHSFSTKTDVSVRIWKSFFHLYSNGVANAIKTDISTTPRSPVVVVPRIIKPPLVPLPSWEYVSTAPPSGCISVNCVSPTTYPLFLV